MVACSVAGAGVPVPDVPAVAGSCAVLPEVPVGVADAVALLEADGDALADAEGVAVALADAGEAADAMVEALGSVAGAAGALADGLLAALAAGAFEDEAADAWAPPPAAFSKSARCERNSTSFARIAGSIVVVPDVPTAPAVPVAGAGAGVAAAVVASALPISASRFPCSLVYEARQSTLVVISSLKLLINCDTCVRASPVSCAAAGSCVIWLRVSRAAVR